MEDIDEAPRSTTEQGKRIEKGKKKVRKQPKTSKIQDKKLIIGKNNGKKVAIWMFFYHFHAFHWFTIDF